MPPVQLPRVFVDGYSALRFVPMGEPDAGRYLGDRTNDAALLAILRDKCREAARLGHEVLPETEIEGLRDADLDRMLDADNPDLRAVVRDAAGAFGLRLADVIEGFLGWDYWQGTEHIVVGGGFSGTRIGALAIAAARELVQERHPGLDVQPIRHHPDEAGLIGVLHLAEPETLKPYDCMLAVDLGGTKVRAGVVRFAAETDPGFAGAGVWRKEVWRHAEDAPDRESLIRRIAEMLRDFADQAAAAGLAPAPQIGFGLPGVVDDEGFIHRGAHNLPGDWEADDFNLRVVLAGDLPRIGEHDSEVLLANDAVVQGLSELPFMRDVSRWGIFTIGTGFGNAHFSRRE